ncbi:MFS transporter [Acinetobacter dispersus]|uniref:Major facilitator superfamily (MFS) profile domain-containing protein n=1 Tax=Acinetobacter dispersus TaxID=70348 RepID=N9MZA7_9GAMM|nr:MFS transporter [Acinetobacter dispersus]ENW95189.1 hypothetical protein F904_00480 [Acinetobacter dispersus]
MNTINITDLIDHSKITRHQILVLVLCALCMVIDGFDVQAMGYVAPAIIQEWGIAKADLGSVFGAGLVGMAVGALLLAPLADKFGRRPLLIGAMLALSVCMVVTMFASSIQELIIFRLITGICMGAIIPNCVTLAGEYSPARFRVTLMMIISSGFIFGGVVGGILAAAIIPVWGWQSIFLVGAIAPLALALVMFIKLSESLPFLALKKRRPDILRMWAIRLGHVDAQIEGTKFVVKEPAKEGKAISQLFKNQLAVGTVMLWAVNFMNLLAAYFLANWLPVLMTEAGHGGSNAVLAGAVFWIGGLLGNLILGWFVDRRGFGWTLSLTFIAAAISIALIGQTASTLALAFLVIGAAGFCILGAQTALNALGAVFYPTAVRSTGIGWSLGVGRLGSILGPVLGAELIRLNWSTPNLFFAVTVPVFFALVAILIFWKFGHLPKAASTTHATPIDQKA